MGAAGNEARGSVDDDQGARERVEIADRTSRGRLPGALLDRLTGDPAIPVPDPAPGRRVILALLGFVTAWRLGILGVSYLWGRLGVATPWPPEYGALRFARYSVRWDAGWYLAIAREGYQYTPGEPSSVAFFPLLPLLTRLADALLPGGPVLAALLVVHLALALAVIYVYRVLRLDAPAPVAWLTLAFLLAYPGAFFFSAVYPEALLLLAFAGALYHARRGEWLRAGLFGAFGSATKLMGLAVAAPLLVEAVAQRGVLRRPWRPLLGLALAPAGALAYLAYLQARFGDFRILFETETQWYREALRPVFLLGIERLLGDRSALIFYPATTAPLRSAFLLMDTTLLLLFLAAGVVLWLRVRPSYGALVLAGALIPALSGSPQSLNRYLAVLFPAFLLLGRIRSEALRTMVLILSTLLLAFTTWLYINGYWAG